MSRSAFAVALKKRRGARGPDRSFEEGAAIHLGAMLPADAFWFEVPENGARESAPGFVIFWNRQTFFLSVKGHNAALSWAERALHPKIRAAGIRLEVVRSLAELRARLSEFGIPISAKVRGGRFAA